MVNPLKRTFRTHYFSPNQYRVVLVDLTSKVDLLYRLRMRG